MRDRGREAEEGGLVEKIEMKGERLPLSLSFKLRLTVTLPFRFHSFALSCPAIPLPHSYISLFFSFLFSLCPRRACAAAAVVVACLRIGMIRLCNWAIYNDYHLVIPTDTQFCDPNLDPTS